MFAVLFESDVIQKMVKPQMLPAPGTYQFESDVIQKMVKLLPDFSMLCTSLRVM